MGTTLQADLGGGLLGGSLSQEYSFSFTIESPPPLAVLATYPVNSAPSAWPMPNSTTY